MVVPKFCAALLSSTRSSLDLSTRSWMGCRPARNDGDAVVVGEISVLLGATLLAKCFRRSEKRPSLTYLSSSTLTQMDSRLIMYGLIYISIDMKNVTRGERTHELCSIGSSSLAPSPCICASYADTVAVGEALEWTWVSAIVERNDVCLPPNPGIMGGGGGGG